MHKIIWKCPGYKKRNRKKNPTKENEELEFWIFGTHSHRHKDPYNSLYTQSHVYPPHIHMHKYTQTLPENNRKIMQLAGYVIFATFRCLYRRFNCNNIIILWLISCSFN